ncbi:MAG: alpha/beta fold hydrolase [Kofleriaceae bacterium]
MADIEVREFKLPATDGFELAATLVRPTGEGACRAAVVINSATGVKRGYYTKFATFLAERGLPTLTFDYRGIGGSRPKTLRGFEASVSDWGEKDSAGAIDWVSAELQPSRLLMVGHSIGGQIFGLTPNNDRVHAMLAVGAQSGYWGLWRGTRKIFMWFLWHALMPSATWMFSYFPSKKMGLSEDLPAGVARQWAHWGRNPSYIVDDDGVPMRELFRRYRGPIRSYSFEDDIHAPRACVEYMIGCFENAPKELIHRAPKELGLTEIGHFGFFRDKLRETLWSEAYDWLRQQADAEDQPSPTAAAAAAPAP